MGSFAVRAGGGLGEQGAGEVMLCVLEQGRWCGGG